jgi:hypothetical protein
MTKSRDSYVNLKYFGEFNKYTTALGAATFLYFDKFETGYPVLRTTGAVLSAISVIIGIVTMSILGRIKGEDIDYDSEKDQNKVSLFRIVSRALSVQLLILVVAIVSAGWLSLAKIWKW